MTDPRRTAAIGGALYLVTFATSIPAYALKSSALDDPGSAAGASVQVAAVLEVLLAVACVGTAVVLFPVVRRQSEAAALGFVAARTVEAGLIGLGIVAVLAASGRHGVGATALIAVHDWAFLLGPGLIPAVNALCLGSALYASGLVPRFLPLLGLIGAPLLALSATGTIFGLWSQSSPTAAVLALPIAAWELLVGLRLLVNGFRPAGLHRIGLLTPGHPRMETTDPGRRRPTGIR